MDVLSDFMLNSVNEMIAWIRVTSQTKTPPSKKGLSLSGASAQKSSCSALSTASWMQCRLLSVCEATWPTASPVTIAWALPDGEPIEDVVHEYILRSNKDLLTLCRTLCFSLK